jgi:hypothetical protein
MYRQQNARQSKGQMITHMLRVFERYTYSHIIPYSKVVLEKLIVAQLIKNGAQRTFLCSQESAVLTQAT